MIYALDFDGVICDSAVETGVAGWKAGAQLWSNYSSFMPSESLIEQFCQVRPRMETGYEAILIVRLLQDGETVHSILNDYAEKTQKVINDSNLQIDLLKKLFGETRDQWIKDDLKNWVEMNPLFPSVVKKLQYLSSQDIWYIITTKQERFVKQILNANQIQIADNRIFGLDRKMSKEAVLVELVNKHPEEEIHFIEDRLPALINVHQNEKLQTITLFFALWGYNTAQDKKDAKQKGFKQVELEQFLT